MKLSALIVAKNEEDLVKLCLDSIEPYVDEIIFVDNSSTDGMRDKVLYYGSDKLKLYTYPPTQNMGELRQFSLDQATGEWIFQVDCDEVYPKEAMEAIVRAVNNSGEAISFRVGYHQMSWKSGHKQANFNHFPDRIYRRDVIDQYSGVLPNDMTKVKPEFYQFRPFLEYDNADDRSFENPKQPILPVFYYHLARSRGYNFELNKWRNYNKNIHPEWSAEESERNTRENCWVSGCFDLEQIIVPNGVPTQNIPQPKVDVIIPTFNYGEFIGECIQSVLNQTYKAHSIVVVDDGSTDNTEEIVKGFEGVTYIKQTNSGPAEARNNGAMNADGDFLIFLDSDDEIKNDFIKKTLKKQQETEAEIVSTNLEFFGEQEGEYCYPPHSHEVMLQWQNVPSTCALIKRQAHNVIGGFNKSAHFEDWAYWLEMDKRGFTFAKVEEVLFKYRKHGESRITELDKRQEHGFQQLRDWYGIKR